MPSVGKRPRFGRATSTNYLAVDCGCDLSNFDFEYLATKRFVRSWRRDVPNEISERHLARNDPVSPFAAVWAEPSGRSHTPGVGLEEVDCASSAGAGAVVVRSSSHVRQQAAARQVAEAQWADGRGLGVARSGRTGPPPRLATETSSVGGRR